MTEFNPVAHPTKPDPHQQPRAFLQYLFEVAVWRAQPSQCLPPHLPSPPRPPGITVVLGAGKAAAAMAQCVEQHWRANAPLSGLVVTRYGHIPPRTLGLPQRIEVIEAAHPIPDAASQTAAVRIFELASQLKPPDLALCLISGGGSSLMAAPAPGLTLKDKQSIGEQLLLSGASIDQINCVRKHLSSIKGGRLAMACSPAKVVTLAISDVPGDDPAIIASGPTVADPSTCQQALEILKRYNIDIPPQARALLQNGSLETPKPDNSWMDNQTYKLVATANDALQAAAKACHDAGIAAYVLGDEMEGESREVAKVHASLARSIIKRGHPFKAPCVVLSGGETSVTVASPSWGHPKGKGGRCAEFCLSLAGALKGQNGVWALAADTDGIDGTQDNAGAFVQPDTLERSKNLGLNWLDYLTRSDSYTFFERMGDLLHTGPTFTNVNDFRAILIL